MFRVACLQNEVCRKDFIRATKFLTRNPLKSSPRFSKCRKGGVWSRGVCRHTKNRQNRQKCAAMPVSLGPLSAVIGGGKRPSKPPKPSNTHTHTHTPSGTTPLCSILRFLSLYFVAPKKSRKIPPSENQERELHLDLQHFLAERRKLPHTIRTAKPLPL